MQRFDPDEILEDWYATHYSSVAVTASDSLFGRYMHRAMERRHRPQTSFPSVLEVGGNVGEHVPFVLHHYERYVLTDRRRPAPPPELLADPRLTVDACDVQDLPYDDASFDRAIATCLLHHVDSPARAAMEMRRVTRTDGVVTILVPADPGFAYRVGRALTSRRAARKQRLTERFDLVHALDHPNHVSSILTQVRAVFADDDVAVDCLPFRIPSWNLNAFLVVNAKLRR